MEQFVVVILWLIAAPFWLAWKLLQLIWYYVAKPLLEARAHKSDVAAFEAQKQSPAQLARDEARAKQLADLAAVAPKGFPDRMRATVQVNEIKVPVMEQQRISRLFVEDTFLDFEAGECIRYAVDMILELPETDRALMKQHDIYDILIEEEPGLDKRETYRRQRDTEERVSAAKDSYYKEAVQSAGELSLAMAKSDTKETRVGDYLVAPFSRIFDTQHDATLYAEKLKTKILPQIKGLLDTYRTHKRTDTVEF